MRAAVVTGGSRGLGAVLCEEFEKRGWSVIEFSRTAPHPYSVAVDLARTYDAAALFDETFASLSGDECGEVVAIGNAAVLGPVGQVAQVQPEDVARAIDINVTAAILFVRAFVRAFQTHSCGRTFVNISSGAAIHAHAGWSLYSASKASMEHFVRTVAAEQAADPHPIRMINVNPGVMDTAMQAEVRSASPEEFPEVERYVSLYEDGRLAPPAAVASAIVDLVASRPRSGETYTIDR